MIICWVPAMLFEDKWLDHFALVRRKKPYALHFSSNCCGIRLSKGSCNTTGRCIWQNDLEVYSSPNPWPALCSDKKGICILTDNSDRARGCNIVRSCSLVPYLLIHGIFYKDSHDYLMPSVFTDWKAIIVPAMNLILFSKATANKKTQNKQTPPNLFISTGIRKKILHKIIIFCKSLICKPAWFFKLAGCCGLNPVGS